MRANLTTAARAAAAVLLLVLTGCGTAADADAVGPPDGRLTMGFSQVGSESGWRTANTKSIQESAAAAGVELLFSDAQQSRDRQIEAIRSFIAQRVDVIAFSPVVETGWDPVLLEARQAGIPVILTDRAIQTSDSSLYQSFLGSDFIEEGNKAGTWLSDLYNTAEEPVSIVEIRGTEDSAPAIERKLGFGAAIAQNPNLKIVASASGDFTRAGGKAVMRDFLASTPDIDVLYAHNDDMGLGAIEAIEEAGEVPGEDIKIITVDAVREGMEALIDGKINYIVECNPLLGPQLMELARKIVAGERVLQRVVTEETVFERSGALAALPGRRY
ncbi:ABC transporter substrate-binding protein [Pseudonocardia humida]|uniref:ABC transporter substrate-binding protein n=1 Tax=Pseudonocardia humida TaxID=2800819 RepID=A0ABT1A0E9_9PSEU|nr:ABC transporter substrate-binding protein [Pseudonocardia humida]MCO1656476.1 ABC transporter substrate-binding protein [Pseudonocardia humida]